MRVGNRAKRYWDARRGMSHYKRTEKVVLDFGNDGQRYTRDGIADRLRINCSPSTYILNEAIRNWSPRSIADLARRMHRDDLWACKRVAEGTMAFWLVCMERRRAGLEEVVWEQKVASGHLRKLEKEKEEKVGSKSRGQPRTATYVGGSFRLKTLVIRNCCIQTNLGQIRRENVAKIFRLHIRVKIRNEVFHRSYNTV